MSTDNKGERFELRCKICDGLVIQVVVPLENMSIPFESLDILICEKCGMWLPCNIDGSTVSGFNIKHIFNNDQ